MFAIAILPHLCEDHAWPKSAVIQGRMVVVIQKNDWFIRA